MSIAASCAQSASTIPQALTPRDPENVMKSEIDQIKLDEGFSATAYVCTAGFLTIGYGYNLERFGAPREIMDLIFQDVEWTEDKATSVLSLTLDGVATALVARAPWLPNCPEEVQRVLLNMAYQMGVTGLMQFRAMHQALRRGDFAAAADEALDSKWARQTPNRANRLAERLRAI